MLVRKLWRVSLAVIQLYFYDWLSALSPLTYCFMSFTHRGAKRMQADTKAHQFLLNNFANL